MTRESARILSESGVLLALATLLGAYGAHALRGDLSAERLSVYLSADRYQYFHSLGLLGVGLAARDVRVALLRWAAALIFLGIMLFCGSLYALSFGAPAVLGAVTPLGGLLLVAGWISFAVAMWGARSR